MVQSLTLIGYSRELTEMAEADKLYPSYDISHNHDLTPDSVSAFKGRYTIWRECY